ncbi:MAG: hypothetical protein M3O70_08925 [Actinomycetota bacterium]|nr:hypothetical protein [Actinomycetota bacterium]
MVWSTPRTWVTGEVVTASIMNTHVRDQFDAGFPHGTTWQTYTPTLTATTTNPTLGSGAVQSGRYYRIGRLVTVHVQIAFGTSGVAAGSGTYLVSAPINIATSLSTVVRMGAGDVFDFSTGARRPVSVAAGLGSGAFQMVYNSGVVTDAQPWTWAASDEIWLFAVYEAA